MQEKIKTIKEACIKANPEIMELKFGCLVKDNSNFIHIIWRKYPPIKIGMEWRTGAWTDVGQQDDITTWEILGRPIRLADVLVAISRDKCCTFTATHEGGNVEGHFQAIILNTIAHWNLLKDSLTDQSEETIDFIYNLLK